MQRFTTFFEGGSTRQSADGVTDLASRRLLSFARTPIVVGLLEPAPMNRRGRVGRRRRPGLETTSEPPTTNFSDSFWGGLNIIEGENQGGSSAKLRVMMHRAKSRLPGISHEQPSVWSRAVESYDNEEGGKRKAERLQIPTIPTLGSSTRSAEECGEARVRCGAS